MHHMKAEYIIFPLMYGLDNIWKSGIWGCKKNLNIEKIIYKIQIKFLAMHINNTKFSFDV